MIPHHKDVTVAQLHHALVRLFLKSTSDLPNGISINLERAQIEKRPTETLASLLRTKLSYTAKQQQQQQKKDS